MKKTVAPKAYPPPHDRLKEVKPPEAKPSAAFAEDSHIIKKPTFKLTL
ncbi:hypothetical protein KBY25_14985 [Ruegeria pomeroyi]|nr:hypothetical protein [Ruegeria pomeroyi]